MTTKNIVKWIYKTLRSVIFSVTLFVVGLYVIVYALFAIPAFTNGVKDMAVSQLSDFLGSRIEIEGFNVYPFNEVKLTGISVFDPEGNECVKIDQIGAGIRLWILLTEGRIELTFGEILGLDAKIVQPRKDAPLNIDFIIKAFAPKQQNREKKPFDLSLKNVILRKSRLSFSRPWIENQKIGNLDLAYLEVSDLAADISIPRLSDKEIEIDLRRLAFKVKDFIQVNKIGLKSRIFPNKIEVENFAFELPQSRIFIPEITLDAGEDKDFNKLLQEKELPLKIIDSYITPSDFASLFPELQNFNQKLNLELLAKGNANVINLESFSFGNPEILSLTFTGAIESLSNIKTAKANISGLNLHAGASALGMAEKMIPRLPQLAANIIPRLGFIDIQGDVTANFETSNFETMLEIKSELFGISIDGAATGSELASLKANGEVNVEDLKLHQMLPGVPVGNVNLNLIGEIAMKRGLPEGMASLVIENFSYKGKEYDGLSLNISRIDEEITGDLLVNNKIATAEGNFRAIIENHDKEINLDLSIESLDLSDLIDMKGYNGYTLSGDISLNAEGSSMETIEGQLTLSDFVFGSQEKEKHLRLHSLQIDSSIADSTHVMELKSDWLDFRAEGDFNFATLPTQINNLAASVFPKLITHKTLNHNQPLSNIDFYALIKKNNTLPEFFNLPVRLLVPVRLSGSLLGSANEASFTLDVPYLQQGKDKLIYDSRIVADIDGDNGILNGLITTTMPVKNGDMALNVNFYGKENALSTDIHWLNPDNANFKGHLILDTEINKNHLSHLPEILLTIQPSVIQMGDTEWNISRSRIAYSDKTVSIDGLKVWHEDQLVEVAGVASPYFEDEVTVTLADIDVDYIFNLLQINYVTFGGVATGEITGHALLSSDPVAETESILIKEFTYNGCLFGQCKASSRWNNDAKEIEIAADISNNGIDLVNASGGIWIGRDSLSFDIDAKKVPVDFVQPFMKVFSSHVGGFATGRVNLYGTFHDIDMTGKIYADSVAVKLDYTNTIYHGSDSVFLTPGRIDIPHFRLYDKFGNSALLTGELSHRYFHDPSFTFRLSDASNFLCYDTNKDINPDWYGTLFGSGSALLKGVPGLVDISADMTVGGNSVFTFVLNDTQYAQDYQFLTFSDKRKESQPKETFTTDDFKAMLKRSLQSDEEGMDKFGIDIRATVTPQVLFTLVMDPAAGDKITARGKGAMQVKYESDNDEMMMYGKYEIEEGNYNFSLQDIILRDFKIKEGSYITFNGNPLAADLDISATYRVNTNLSDLDKSFSTDRDLNRTNVPVDAVLSVNGNMTSPDITFDIELPTLTQDVERKVKSIISTDDMMNRQIIYLLALNRFYTPEYMGNSGNGGELAAVASSTISSQLSNILGQLTDKFSVSPSFRSDKGDFSDIEVDVALSSRLLNNRLLINGNFGYRDRSNSSTTFVGDFDVEYLLSKNGNLRLKAYNHFNDQNYYLREALTTQGLGIVYRRDFDNWFTFLKKRKLNTDSKNKDTEGPEDKTTETNQNFESSQP